eukprot:9996195-Lingulodinium_polyedra.AAC.1
MFRKAAHPQVTPWFPGGDGEPPRSLFANSCCDTKFAAAATTVPYVGRSVRRWAARPRLRKPS